MRTDFYLKHFDEYKAKGLKAFQEGDVKEARYDLLKAAEYLYKLAHETEGKLRDQRIENAKKLTAMAKAIGEGKARAPRKGAGAGGGGGPAKEATGEDEAKQFSVAERPSTRLDDVAGLDDVKEQVRLKLIYPFQHPDKAKRFGVKPGGGILLYGPPGTGKTLIAKAIAGEIEAAFFTVKPSEIMSKWVGEAEQNVAALFKAARAEPVSIIFIDEIESLVPKRRDSSSSVMQRVVPQFLAELEGFDTERKNPVLFIGATNEPWSLDPAVLRPGRFDEMIYIGLPDPAARRKILEMNLKELPLDRDVDLGALAERLSGCSGADIRNICRKAAGEKFIAAIESGVEGPIAMADLVRTAEATKPSVKPKDLERFEKYRAQ